MQVSCSLQSLLLLPYNCIYCTRQGKYMVFAWNLRNLFIYFPLFPFGPTCKSEPLLFSKSGLFIVDAKTKFCSFKITTIRFGSDSHD